MYCWLKPAISANRSWVRPFPSLIRLRFRPTSLRMSMRGGQRITYSKFINYNMYKSWVCAERVSPVFHPQSLARHQHGEFVMTSATRSGSDDVREVRCLNPKCGTLNRVPPYRIEEVPRCKECGRLLPESITTQMLRFAGANPLLWSAFGASLVVAGVVFLDRYSPNLGLIWNAINGTTAGIPTSYFVAAGAVFFFLGLALAAKK